MFVLTRESFIVECKRNNGIMVLLEGVGLNVPKPKRTLPNSQNVPKVQVKTYLLRVVLSRTVVHVIPMLILLSKPSVCQVSTSN